MKFDGWPHVVESQQFSREWLEQDFFPLVKEMERFKEGFDSLSGKNMISFFYQPSTRTRASFEIAMQRLGGRVFFSTENAKEFSSVAKGESLSDTIKVLNIYEPDVIVLRYHEPGGAKIAAGVSRAPVINAGDGPSPGQHPTQALLDFYTIQKRFGEVNGLEIAMVGDLARSRVVRSLSYLLGKYPKVRIYFVSPVEGRINDDIKDYLRKHDIWFKEVDDLERIAPLVDVIYQTRVQDEYEGVLIDISRFTITAEIADSMREKAIIMHPLPRRNEITSDVDDNPRAVYLKEQVASGLFARMALLKMLLSET